MNYKDWIHKIKTSLIALGFPLYYAEERARSLRGCYYDENNYLHPSDAVFKLVTTGYTALGCPKRINQFKKTYRNREL